MKTKRARPPKDKGAALVMVLWGAVVMAIVAAAAARQATTTAVVVNAGAELTRARALADGGVRAGWSAFAEGQINRIDTMWACRSGEDTLFVRLRPETSRIDINAAEPTTLAALFEAAGLERIAADNLAQEVVTYRSHGQFEEGGIAAPIEGEEPVEPQPAEDGRVAPGTFTPGEFQTIEELGYLPGMDAGLFRIIADDVTVYSRSLDVDRRYASPLVREALEHLARTGGLGAATPDAEVTEGSAMPAFEGSLLDVRAVGVTASGAVFVRQATIEGPIDSLAMPRMLRFVQGRLAQEEVLPVAGNAPECGRGFAAVNAAGL